MYNQGYAGYQPQNAVGGLCGSCCGACFGFLMTFLTIWLLYWNEGYAVSMAQSLDEGFAKVVPIDASLSAADLRQYEGT